MRACGARDAGSIPAGGTKSMVRGGAHNVSSIEAPDFGAKAGLSGARVEAGMV